MSSSEKGKKHPDQAREKKYHDLYNIIFFDSSTVQSNTDRCQIKAVNNHGWAQREGKVGLEVAMAEMTFVEICLQSAYKTTGNKKST